MTTSLAQRLAAQLEQTIQYQPRRIVTRSGARVRGTFPSHHFARPMHWESPLERQLIYRLEASWIAVDAATQPVTLKIPELFGEDGECFRLHPGCCRPDPQGRTDLH